MTLLSRHGGSIWGSLWLFMFALLVIASTSSGESGWVKVGVIVGAIVAVGGLVSLLIVIGNLIAGRRRSNKAAATIRRLSDLVHEGISILASAPPHPGITEYGLIDPNYDPNADTELERAHRRALATFETTWDAYEVRARQIIADTCREFLGDWDSARAEEKIERIRGMIQELRGVRKAAPLE
jgi:hypothetical protein